MSTAQLAHQRREHLRKCSQVLAATSPAASSHIRTLMAALPGQADQKEILACSGCGSILLPGCNCARVRLRPGKDRKQSRQNRINQVASNKCMTWECSRCKTITTVEVPKQKTKRPSKPSPKNHGAPSKIDVRSAEPAVPIIPAATDVALDSAGVKKRSRGKKSTLQSMLADRKPALPTKGFDLNLNDFLKT